MKFRKSKTYDYLSEFSELSKFAVQAADFLKSTLKEYQDIDVTEMRAEIHEIEHAADDAKHGMMRRLMSEFLPPIDREDIIGLSHNIDGVTDAIEDVLICYDMFGVSTVYRDVLEFADLILECCVHMNAALLEMKNYRKSESIFDEIDKVNRLKSRGEALYVDSLRKLYQASEDPIHIMAYTEIYKRLQKCCEKCKTVTNKIESIVLKNI
ncbi:putative pit accessory protein [Andreesenia angusta]|uniref:Putative pit accessory protein n=1 Tax=Andreesenia angusta TaxID=39480 RepID=A0A1S1V9U1_9FIRM|nr:DUF47 family protein [Andreesenia angusta]OHW63284.1 putative pit accessory protein [Andreesenia angusta]